MRTVSVKSRRENQNTHFMYNTFFFQIRVIYEIIWENSVQPNRPQITAWRMRIVCWIPKATNTHSEFVIRIALPLPCVFSVFQLDDEPVGSKHLAIIETNIFCNKEWSRGLYKFNGLTYPSSESVFDVFV